MVDDKENQVEKTKGPENVDKGTISEDTPAQQGVNMGVRCSGIYRLRSRS